MTNKPEQPKMENISSETAAKLRAIEARVGELNEEIKRLNEEAYALVQKHTFDECRKMGCIHTARNRTDCHCNCVRRQYAYLAFRDYYEKKKEVVKFPQHYPMLGWKTVATPGSKWGDGWHVFKVIKETERTLVLEFGTVLNKSTMLTVEDVVYLCERNGGYYHFCADDPDTLDMKKTLLDVYFKEKSDNCHLSTPSDDKYQGLNQLPGESREEFERRIFGDDDCDGIKL